MRPIAVVALATVKRGGLVRPRAFSVPAHDQRGGREKAEDLSRWPACRRSRGTRRSGTGSCSATGAVAPARR